MAEQEFLTRRQLRELERRGGAKPGATRPTETESFAPRVSSPAQKTQSDGSGQTSSGPAQLPNPQAAPGSEVGSHFAPQPHEQTSGGPGTASLIIPPRTTDTGGVPTSRPSSAGGTGPNVALPEPVSSMPVSSPGLPGETSRQSGSPVLPATEASPAMRPVRTEQGVAAPAMVTPPHFTSRRELRHWQEENGVADSAIPSTSLPTEAMSIVSPSQQTESVSAQNIFSSAIAGEARGDGDSRPKPKRGFALLPEEAIDTSSSSTPTERADEAATAPETAPEVASAPDTPALVIPGVTDVEPEPDVPPAVAPATAFSAASEPVGLLAADSKAIQSDAIAALWTSPSSKIDENTDSNGISGTLVLSDMPSELDLRAPLDETGEVMLTGTISLPSSMSSTGVIPNGFEDSDEIDDHGYVIRNANRPVAVSSLVAESTAERVLPHARSSHRLTVALSIVAGALVLAAVGMIVYYFVVGGQ